MDALPVESVDAAVGRLMPYYHLRRNGASRFTIICRMTDRVPPPAFRSAYRRAGRENHIITHREAFSGKMIP